MATSLELAKSQPDEMEFNSLLGLARGINKDKIKRRYLGAYIDFQRMIRKDGLNLLFIQKSKNNFIDLKNDPLEMNDFPLMTYIVKEKIYLMIYNYFKRNLVIPWTCQI